MPRCGTGPAERRQQRLDLAEFSGAFAPDPFDPAHLQPFFTQIVVIFERKARFAIVFLGTRREFLTALGIAAVAPNVGCASAGAGAWWGGFWGLLFGMLFFIPFAGLALGAGMGALFGHFGEKGIDKAFQQQVRDYLKPGTSALFMVIEQATPDKAIAALQQYGGTVIRTSLSEEDTKKLQDALQPPAPVS